MTKVALLKRNQYFGSNKEMYFNTFEQAGLICCAIVDCSRSLKAIIERVFFILVVVVKSNYYPIPRPRPLLSVTKTAHGDISETKKGIIDPLKKKY